MVPRCSRGCPRAHHSSLGNPQCSFGFSKIPQALGPRAFLNCCVCPWSARWPRRKIDIKTTGEQTRGSYWVASVASGRFSAGSADYEVAMFAFVVPLRLFVYPFDNVWEPLSAPLCCSNSQTKGYKYEANNFQGAQAHVSQVTCASLQTLCDFLGSL